MYKKYKDFWRAMGKIICNENLFLRDITLYDTDIVLSWRNSEFVQKYFIYQEKITEEEHLKWMNQKVFTGKVTQFIIVSNDVPIGSVYLQNIDNFNKKAEYGIFIGSQEGCGKGIGTIVAKCILKYAFEEMQLHRVYLRVLENNIRAIRCYERAGFRREALLVDDVQINGEYQNIVIMATLNKTISENEKSNGKY